MGQTTDDASKTVAVVGSGISGLAAAYLLEQQGLRVTLFESEAVAGGHALTVDTDLVGPIDLGFQVCNRTTYPHLLGFLNTLGVDTEPSDMSFALSTDEIEWGSRTVSAVFATPGSSRSPRFLRMIYDVFRFGRQAPEVLSSDVWAQMTLGEYLKKRRYSEYFRLNYVLPMCAAIWSCSPADAMAFPIVTLVRFWKNHHLLELFERPVWRVLRGRSRAYVDAACKALTDVKLSTPVRKVVRLPTGKVEVQYGQAATTTSETFDHVVLATHTDITRALLSEGALAEEAAALEDIGYTPNEVYLHTDETLMPRDRTTWASWNCISRGSGKGGGEPSSAAVCVSYWINLLQNLPASAPDVFVTLNPPSPPDPAKTLHRLTLAHPLFNKAAIAAQKRLTGELQGVGGVWYCGAWCGYGFHEDGIASAVAMVQRMLRTAEPPVPWNAVSCKMQSTYLERTFTMLFTKMGGAMIPAGGACRLILPSGAEALLGDPHAKEVISLSVNNARLFQRVVLRSDIGLGEAYMDGDFEVTGGADVYDFLRMVCRTGQGQQAKDQNYKALGVLGGLLYYVGEKLEYAAHRRNSNTVEGSARNIAYHYDAGNDFYKLFLDRTMMYSSGIHPGLLGSLEGSSFEEKEAALETASYAKIDAMIERAELRPGEHVLEIGCGWGECAIRMASKAGVRVTGITISKEQLAEARERVKAAGLSDRINLVFCDYRKVVGTFDKIVSIEMIEAVGAEHLPTFFQSMSRYLKPGGIAAIQVITLPDHRYEAYVHQHSDFIRTYIFPGGHLPSLGAMVSLSSYYGLEFEGARNLGFDYAVTLRLWRERMMARTRQVLALGYPMRFIRMYEFYFAYCEAGFAAGLIHDYQIAFRKPYDADAPAAPPSNTAAATSAPVMTDTPTAVRSDIAEAPPSFMPTRDPLTLCLMAMWAVLLGLLTLSKPHTIVLLLGFCASLLVDFVLRHTLSIRSKRASMLHALIGGIVISASAGALLWRAADVALADAAIAPARAVVGCAAGFGAIRAWKCINDERRSAHFWETGGYIVSLICCSTALYHDSWLLGVAWTQLCEAHSSLLRLRSLRIQSGAIPSAQLWLATWAAFWIVRIAPHALLATLLLTGGGQQARAPPPPLYTDFVFLLGSLYTLLSDVAMGWSMLRAFFADRQVAIIEEGATKGHNKRE